MFGVRQYFKTLASWAVITGILYFVCYKFKVKFYLTESNTIYVLLINLWYILRRRKFSPKVKVAFLVSVLVTSSVFLIVTDILIWKLPTLRSLGLLI